MSGHHLHPPAAINFEKIKEYDLVKIVWFYDTFCEEVCEMGCDYRETVKGEQIWEADVAIAELYGFEIKKEYSVEEFIEKMYAITEEQGRKGSDITAKFFGVM